MTVALPPGEGFLPFGGDPGYNRQDKRATRGQVMRRALGIALVGALLVLGSCGDDDSTASSDAGSSGTTAAANTSTTGADDGADDAAAAPSGGGGAGSITLDGEEIALGPGRCYLQEQPAAAGGGSIELTAQAQGTNAAGDDVRIDFSRYSEDSQFAGDDVSIDVGPLGSSVNYHGSEPSGAVSVDGNLVSASDFTVQDDQFQDVAVSFSISC